MISSILKFPNSILDLITQSLSWRKKEKERGGVGEEGEGKQEQEEQQRRLIFRLNLIHIRHKPYTGGTLLGMCISVNMKYHCNTVWKIMHIVFV
jgi:hypothetical protein